MPRVLCASCVVAVFVLVRLTVYEGGVGVCGRVTETYAFVSAWVACTCVCCVFGVLQCFY